MASERLIQENGRSQYYPRFSDAEFERRWEATRDIMRREDLDVLAVYAGSKANSTISYLTNFGGRFNTYLVFFADPDEEPTLFVGNNNNCQYAREKSILEDIRPMIPAPVERVIQRIKEGGAADGRVGLVGVAPRYDMSLPHGHYQLYEKELDAELVDATTLFTKERTVHSEEELEWLRKGAELTDLAMEALVEAAEPGVKEYELAAAVEAASLENGGQPHLTYFTSTSMEDPGPGECLAWKSPSNRTLQRGDVISDEIGASYWGYAGQIHRPIAVGSPPTDQYQDLFDVALETVENTLDVLKPGNTTKDVHEAFAPLEESEYKIYDVGLHGFGNAYLPPFVGTTDSDYWPGEPDSLAENWTFQENQVVVVQPSPTTADERFGIQLGTTAVIKKGGPEVLQQYPMEFVEV